MIVKKGKWFAHSQIKQISSDESWAYFTSHGLIILFSRLCIDMRCVIKLFTGRLGFKELFNPITELGGSAFM